VTRVLLKKLQPAPWNPRTIKDERFQNLCRSLEADPEFMVLRPVLATKDGTIYAGNMRYRAAAHLGWTEIEAQLTDIPEQLAKERALRDNAGWGENVDESLGALLAELKEAGSDIDLLGFDSPEIDRLLAGVTQMPEEDEADLEPPVEPITKPGDLWLLGEHRLLCGDSTNLTDVERLMNGERAVVCLTDPPYSVAYEDLEREPGRVTRRELGDAYRDPQNAEVLLHGFIAILPSDVLVLTYVFNKHFQEMAAATTEFDLLYECVWVKQHFTFIMGRRYQPKHEPILIFRRKGATGVFNVPANQSTVFEYDKAARNPDHPTPKPVELWVKLMEYHSNRGDVVYEPFGGSGTTIAAAEQLGRLARVMELQPGYCDVIVARWERLTGRTAVLDTSKIPELVSI
jgi:DNA modification methylase